MCNKNTVNSVLSEYAQMKIMEKEIKEEINRLKKELMDFLESEKCESFTGNEHSVTAKMVPDPRFQTAKFKADFPDLAEKYTVDKGKIYFRVQ